MKIILLQDVPKIGRKYEVKHVADGYAANFLLPRKLALAASKAAIERFDGEKKKIQAADELQETLFLKNLEELSGKTIVVEEKANEQGHLFAGIDKGEVALAVKNGTRLEINPQMIDLDKPIKETGEFTLTARVGEKAVTFILNIKAA